MTHYWRIVATIFMKEGRDLVRNRTALLTTFVYAPLLIPGVFVLLGALFMVTQPSYSQGGAVEVLTINPPSNPALMAAFDRRDIRLLDATQYFTADKSYDEAALKLYRMSMDRRFPDGERLSSSVAAGYVLAFPPAFDAKTAAMQAVEARLVFDSSNNDMSQLAGRIRSVFETVADEQAEKILSTVGLSFETIRPLSLMESDQITPKASRVQILGGMVALLFIIALELGRGQTYQAYWGERQKNTMEPLLLAPVSGIPVALGKMALVMVIAILASMFLLGAFFGSINVLVFASEKWTFAQSAGLAMSEGFSLHEFFVALGLLVPAVVLGVVLSHYLCVAARTERSAQTLMGIATFSFFTINALVLMSPVTDLTSLSIVPLVSQVTLMHLHLRGEEISIALLAASWATTFVACWVLLWLVGREYRALSQGLRPLEV